FFFSSRRRHTRSKRDWSSDVCSSDLSGFIKSQGIFLVSYFPSSSSILIRYFSIMLSFERPRQAASCSRSSSGRIPRYILQQFLRSEERRVGKECISGRRRDETSNRRD